MSELEEVSTKHKRTARQVGGVHTSVNRAKRALRNREIVEKKIKGQSVHELAEEYELSVRQIRNIVYAFADDYSQETTQKLRNLENHKLDVLERNLWDSNAEGDISATKVSLAISHRRSELNGLSYNDSLKANAAMMNAANNAATVKDMIALLDFVVDKLDIPWSERGKLPDFIKEGIATLGLRTLMGEESTYVDAEVVEDSDDWGEPFEEEGVE